MYIHHLWKQSTIPLIDVGDITYSGWFQDGEISYTEDVYPSELDEIFGEEEEDDSDEDDEEDYYGEEIETDDEESDNEY